MQESSLLLWALELTLMDKKIPTARPSEIQTMPSNQTSELALIKNITSTQNKVFEKMATVHNQVINSRSNYRHECFLSRYCPGSAWA